MVRICESLVFWIRALKGITPVPKTHRALLVLLGRRCSPNSEQHSALRSQTINHTQPYTLKTIHLKNCTPLHLYNHASSTVPTIPIPKPYNQYLTANASTVSSDCSVRPPPAGGTTQEPWKGLPKVNSPARQWVFKGGDRLERRF